MDELELLARARRARRLLAEPDIQAAFADIEADLLTAIRHTAWDDVRLRECKHAELRATDRLRAKLQEWADELIHRNID